MLEKAKELLGQIFLKVLEVFNFLIDVVLKALGWSKIKIDEILEARRDV